MAKDDKEKVEDQSPAANETDAPVASDAEIDQQVDGLEAPAGASGLSNTPEVEHRLSEGDGNDAQAEVRKAVEESVQNTLDAAQASADRAMAMAAPVQKVTDGNEVSALATISGQRPLRDLSDAPAPARLGPHHESTEKA